MPLSDAKVRTARPRTKPYKLWDELGLHLAVRPSGSRLWRCRVRVYGKETLLSFGTYPEVSLADARRRRDEALKKLRSGADPRQERITAELAGSFAHVAGQWLTHLEQTRGVTGDTIEKTRRRLESWVYPKVGNKPIGQVEAEDFVPVLEAIQRAGKGDTIRKTRQAICRVMRFAIGRGWSKIDPTTVLQETVRPPPHRKRPAITDPKAVGRLLLAIDGYNGRPVTRYALAIAPHVFLRPGELRRGQWSQIDWREALWRFPGGTMKKRRVHLVPLSTRVLELLRELHAITGAARPGQSDWMFPLDVRGRDRPMCENAVNGAIRRLGYGPDEMTAHGFRSIASTLLNEMKRARGWHEDAIERQLAHVEENEVRGIYNEAEYLPERREMMEVWSTYLDSLAAVAAEEDRASAMRSAAQA